MSRFPYVLAAAALSLAGTVAVAQQPPRPAAGSPMKEEKPGLLAQATVTPDSARAVALAQVANGRIAEQEIEVEKGTLAYSFDIKVPGKAGIEEVLVDAKTGAVIAHEHEGPKQERAERMKEAKEKRAARPN